VPAPLNRRTRQLGAAIIGYLGAFSILAAIRWTAEADPEWLWRWALDWRLLFVIAGVGALIRAGLVDVMGKPGKAGWLRDIAITVLAGVAAALIEAALHDGAFGIFIPIAALLTLSFPFVTLAILAEAAASLAYARLTAPAAPKPATSPPA
jgi:hypothetical protein